MSESFQSGGSASVKNINKTRQGNIVSRRYIYRKHRLKLDLNPIAKSKQPEPSFKSRSVVFQKQNQQKETSILEDYHYDSEDFSQISFGSEAQKQEKICFQDSRLLPGWTDQKWKRAKEFFSGLANNINVQQIRSLAQELGLSQMKVLQGWKSYQRGIQIHSFQAETSRIHQQRLQQNQYILSKLQQMISKDGTLTLNQMKTILLEQIRKEKRYVIPSISLSKINILLRNAGYNRRKFAPTVFQKNTQQNTARRQQFCRYLKTLRAYNMPIYFYHETELGKYNYRNQGWAKDGERIQTKGFIDKKVTLRCLLSPQGFASWQLTYESTNRKQLQSLIDKLSKSDPTYSKKYRKFLMVDKRAICNRDQFCQTVESNEFDIISMPVASIILNPIDRWFKRINNELRCEYYNSREDLMKKSECLLLRFNKKSLNWYLQYFPQELENCLPVN